MSKCHIVGNLVPRLNYRTQRVKQVYFAKRSKLAGCFVDKKMVDDKAMGNKKQKGASPIYPKFEQGNSMCIQLCKNTKRTYL